LYHLDYKCPSPFPSSPPEGEDKRRGEFIYHSHLVSSPLEGEEQRRGGYFNVTRYAASDLRSSSDKPA
jgi:hypothetical protein